MSAGGVAQVVLGIVSWLWIGSVVIGWLTSSEPVLRDANGHLRPWFAVAIIVAGVLALAAVGRIVS